MASMGRTLVIVGLAIAGLGALLWLLERAGLGRLPGDLTFKRRGFEVHIPIVTSLVLSVVLTLLLNLFLRRK